MSTILKALRRLESERTRPGRSLREEVMEPRARARRARGPLPVLPLLLVTGVALLVGGGLAAGWSIFFAGEEPAVSAAEPSVAPGAAAHPGPARETGTARVAPAPPAARRPIGIADEAPPDARSRATALAPAPSDRAAGPPPPAAQRPALAPPPSAPQPAPAPTPPAAPTPRPAARETARAAPAPEPRAPVREPVIDPDVQVIARPQPPPLPDLRVAQTRWHPQADRRVAVVEVAGHAGTLELHEGDAVGGLVVVRIDPSGVVFRHGRSEIRERVGGD